MARKSQDVSIYRIADEAGVSVATVSRVMNRRAGVSESMRLKIDSLLRKYNFQANYPKQRSARIAILTQEGNFNSYVMEVLRGIYRYTGPNGIAANIIIRSHDDQETIFEQVRDQQCSGVIVVLPEGPEEYLKLCHSELPVMFIDHPFQIEGSGFVDHDSYSGSKEAAEYLIGLGHRKIAFLCYHYMTLNMLQRFKGYENALCTAGIEIQPEWIVRGRADAHYEPVHSIGMVLAEQMLKQAPEVTAVMTVDDVISFGVLTAIQKSGRRIPEDMSVVGFDNYPMSSCLYPALTTVNHPIAEAGYLAAKAVSEALVSHGKHHLPHEILPTRLVIRESTGPVKKI